MDRTWTMQEIKVKILTDQRWLERAVVAIYRRQTSQEQISETTLDHNCRGFSAFDAKMGTYYAKWIQGGKNLSGKHLEKAKKMMQKYVGQLEKVANA